MTKDQQFEVLIARRIFPITARIDNGLITDMERALFHMCLEDQKKKVELIIDSNGGDTFVALSGYDFIKSLPFEVECTIIGDCHSATLTLMAACSKRKATKHSRFLFHAMQSSPTYKSTEDIREQIEVKIQQFTSYFEQALDVQHHAYGIAKDELLKMRKIGEQYDVRLTAQEAKEKGIIHEIVEKFDFFDPVK